MFENSTLRCATLFVLFSACCVILCDRGYAETPNLPALGIQDNSFLIEEAYNQEPGVVQHILNVVGTIDRLHGPDDQALTLAFTQEWPICSQTHQFSYTVPYTFTHGADGSADGLGDIFLNYRFQLFTETPMRPAIAPRLSFILPTGDQSEGFGNGRLGYQFNLPVSKVVAARWSVHANAGVTYFPDVSGHDLTSYNLGVSAIYAMRPNFNLLVECVGNWNAEIGDDVRRERSFAPVISPGFRYGINLPNDAQFVAGLAVPIGLTKDAPDFGVFLYFSFEHSFTRSAEQPRELSLVSSK